MNFLILDFHPIFEASRELWAGARSGTRLKEREQMRVPADYQSANKTKSLLFRGAYIVDMPIVDMSTMRAPKLRLPYLACPLH